MRVAVLGSTAGRRYFLLSVSSIAIVVAAVSVLVVPVNALWLRPLSIPSPDGLVIVTATNQDSDGSRFSERGLERLAASNVFAGVAGQVLDRDLFVGLRPQIAFPDGAPVEVLSVTANYFNVVGVPVTGRAFESTDMIEGSPPVAIVSDRFWRTRLGGRPMLGAPLGTRQGPILIVGIASPDFHGALRGENVDLWIPYTLLPRLNRLSAADLVIPFISLCRLPHGASVWGAQAALSAESGRERIVTPVSELFAGGDSPLVRVRERNVMTAVGLTAVLVLLAGCGALMALVLVHHERRQPELAVRAALGATRVHILTLLGRELLMVLACGLGAGLLLLAVVLRWLPRFQLPGGIDFNRLNLAIDWRVVVGAFAAAGLAAIGATALTFLRAASSAGGMHQIASVRGAAPGALKTGSAVVFLHTAVTVTVLIAAVLFVRTVRYGLHSAPGFDASRVLFVSVQTRPFVEVEVADRDERALSDTGAVYRLIETLRQTPSVSAVVVGGPPIGPDRERAFRTPRQVRVDGADSYMVQLGWLSVGPGYLDALGTPLLLGREGRGPEAVITPRLAEELWPGESPIGRRISFAAFTGEVVGVASIALGSVRLGDSSAVLSFEQADMLPRVVRNSSRFALTIRSTAPALVKPIALSLTQQALPDATAIDVSTGEEILAVDIGRQRLASWFFSAYGVVAVLFALSGIYGLVSYVAHARQRDFCIMVALGAPYRTVILRALGGTIAPVLAGTVAGSLAAALLSNVTQALLLNQSAADPLVFAGVGVAIVLASITAGLVAAIPLRRLSPMTVLQPVA